MTLTFFEFGNTETFNRKNIEKELMPWEEGIAVGDSVHYHDSARGTRPLGKVVSVSPGREYLLLRLAGHERFVIVRKINQNGYLVAKSDLAEMLDTTGKLYYEGAVALQDVVWERDVEGAMHVAFLWYRYDERRMFADIVNLREGPQKGEGELADFISGRYTLSE